MENKLTDLRKQFREGTISRRDFIQALLATGIVFGGAACGFKPESFIAAPTQTPTPIGHIPYMDNIDTTDTHLEIGELDASLVTSEISPGSTPSPTLVPKQLEWFCASCGNQFRSVEDLKEHAAQEHGWRLPEINRLSKPPYEKFIVGRIKRFDERNTAFSRSAWDKEYQAEIAAAMARAKPDTWETFEGRALTAGAIYVDATAGSFHPNYHGYNGYVRDYGGLFGWEDTVNKTQFPIPSRDWMTDRIKKVARFYGADLVGICEIDRRWVYSHYFERATGNYEKLEIPYKYAIVIGLEMDWKLINQSPGHGASAATALIYSKMAEVSASLAKYIRALGYPAVPSGNDTIQNIPLAIDAGLGEVGRNGILNTPEYGPRVRICKVLTDLPLNIDQPIEFGLHEFCENCHICSRTCPVDAIRDEEPTTEITSYSNREGLLRWPVNVTKCLEFWRENGCDCSNCIAVCPWAMHSSRVWLKDL
jgi:epoxyqueuosine reductase